MADLLVIALLVAIAGPAWEVWVAVSARKTPACSSGTVVLKHTPQAKALGWAGLICFTAGPVIVFAGETPEAARNPWAICSMAALFLLAAIYFLETRSQVTLDERGIHDFKMWRGHRTIEWKDVTRVRSGVFASWLVISTAGGRVIRFSKDLRGIGCFWESCKHHVDPAAYRAALPRDR